MVAAANPVGVTVVEAEQQGAARPLTARGLDVWLLGGASLVVWALVLILDRFRAGNWAVSHHFDNIPYAASTLSLVVNYPHFMASYRLGYGRGWHFVSRHPLQLLVAPIAILALLALAYVWYLTPVADGNVLARVGGALRGIGLELPVGQGTTRGHEIVGLLTAFMFLTVGWHYSKQAYGAMMVVAHFDGYPLDRRQRDVARLSLHAVWLVNWLNANYRTGDRALHAALAWTVTGIAVLAFLWFVVVQNVRSARRWPSARFVVPWLAFGAWWLPPLTHEVYLVHLVPFFHGLQYLVFVHKVERSRVMAEHPGSAQTRGVLVAFALVAIGFAAFELVPNLFDVWLDTNARFGGWFFLTAAVIYLNLHHYFIDNVVWRLRDHDTRRHLLS